MFQFKLLRSCLIIIKAMQEIFRKMEEIKDIRALLRYWCRQNQIKISFTVNVTFSKSKAIYRKLQATYRKGFGRSQSRWLENELKLFHFAVLAVSAITESKIVDFNEKQWNILEEAFPKKPQTILEYEAKNFIINKNQLKNKWEIQQDQLLTSLIQQTEEEPKWNEIAIQLFTNSNKQFFRNGKQCRERWLNHLDKSIKHQKWTEDEDLVLIKGVHEHGKKWSRIMKCFQNQRTQHMIKNRFLSLILKCKKLHPFIQDEESALEKINQQMGLSTDYQNSNEDNIYTERRLRPKSFQIIRQENSEESEKEVQEPEVKIFVDECQEVDAQIVNENNEEKIVGQYSEQKLISPVQCLKLQSSSTLPTPSPSAFMTPVQFLNCNTFFPGFGYFQCYMNDFYSQINGSSSFHNPQ